MQEQHREETFHVEVKQALADQGVIGFDPESDAVRQPTTSGPRYYYCDEGELKWASRSPHGGKTWGSPATMKIERFRETLEAVDEFEIVSKEAFDFFSDLDVDGVHDGLCWGIASIYGEDTAHEMTLDRWGLEAVPGIGKTLGSRIVKTINEQEE